MKYFVPSQIFGLATPLPDQWKNAITIINNLSYLGINSVTFSRNQRTEIKHGLYQSTVYIGTKVSETFVPRIPICESFSRNPILCRINFYVQPGWKDNTKSDVLSYKIGNYESLR